MGHRKMVFTMKICYMNMQIHLAKTNLNCGSGDAIGKKKPRMRIRTVCRVENSVWATGKIRTGAHSAYIRLLFQMRGINLSLYTA